METLTRQRRIVGRVEGQRPGPVLLVSCALHGNERAGVEAAERVIAGVERLRSHLRGRFVALAGNLPALSRGKRFIDRDLNRAWTARRLEEIERGGPAGPDVEAGEQRELIREIARSLDGADGPVFFLDLHTSSAEGPPFVTVGDTMRNRRFAERFPLPLILGLEEQIDGSLLEFLSNYGFVTMGVEGGQHASREAVNRHEAVLWTALAVSGALPVDRVPRFEAHQQLLREASRGVPPVIEVRRRHAIRSDDGFAMNPGYRNFSPIRRRERLACDVHGDVLSVEDGLLLLPLYQGQGDDGFFIAREVRPFWLRLSTVLRILRFDALVRLLPGVRRHPTLADSLVADTRIARFYPLEIFHLLGFRKRRRAGVRLTVSRRPYDRRAPSRIVFP